jgi:hypothetical protein
MASSTSGPAAANATLTDATAPICSQPSSTDGSGPALRLRSHPPINALWEIGPTPVEMVALSPTTAKMT